MGNLWARLFGATERRILMLGLDSAGKTTILYNLKLGEVVTTVPTIGFNVETLEYHGVSMTVWDVGGQDKLRPLWRHYYDATDGVIFVVDSADRERAAVAREELHKLMSEEGLKSAVLLVFANKQDLPNAMSAAEVVDALQLRLFKNHKWLVRASRATANQGIMEGLDELTSAILKR